MNFDRANDPNAARLIESLRHLGYGNYEAVADIVDNAIDAEAPQVTISVHQHQGDIAIVIADDGTGMDYETLNEAMKLGSAIERNVNSDLGKFGMGLVTASLSIAKRCHVVTRGADGALSSIQDVDEIIKRNAFVKHLDKATPEEVAMLDSIIGADNTGTVVTLTNSDGLSNRNTTNFALVLRNHLGRVHRYFIEAGRRIVVNGDPVESKDPLQLSDEATETVIDDLIPVKVGIDGSKREETIRVRIALVPETTASELDIGRSMKAQGFYIMRNQREVMNAITLDYFTKHNDFNRMRGEIFFPGTLDKLVGIEFTKRQVNLDQSLDDQLAQVIRPICRSIKRQERGRRRVETSDAQREVHDRSAKAIAEKDKLLVKPKARVEKRKLRTLQGNGAGSDGPKKEHPPTGRKRGNFRNTQEIESRLNCEFREEKLGPNGQIYEADLEGRKVIIRYNVEHPFYQRFLVETLGEGKGASAADFLIYSMATAELRLMDDGVLDAVNNFKITMSSNLRTLLN